MPSDHRGRAAAVAVERRRQILKLLASGLSRPKVAGNLGISKQRLAVILRRVSAADLEAALAAGAGKARCPHCGLFVAPREAGCRTADRCGTSMRACSRSIMLIARCEGVANGPGRARQAPVSP